VAAADVAPLLVAAGVGVGDDIDDDDGCRTRRLLGESVVDGRGDIDDDVVGGT
jgi:hypothetical protein